MQSGLCHVLGSGNLAPSLSTPLLAFSCRPRHGLPPRMASGTAPWGHRRRMWHRQGAAATDDLLTGEDFYSLMGLSPLASPSEVRSAYRGLMRELHPDLVAHAGQDVQDQATQLAMLLNQIYHTLTDPEARAVYDMLAGFAEDKSTNPFLDTTFSRDQVFVDECTCIGCGKCVRQCPATFEIEDSKYGRARVISQTSDVLEEIEIAIEVCPVSCIYWVSLPQLSLLEAALTVLPRVEVFILQRGHSGMAVGNVFEEAYKAYEKRRAAASARARAATHKASSAGQPFKNKDWSWWNQRPQDIPQDTEQNLGDPELRRVATLAAAAARAVRLWQSQGRALRVKGVLADTSSAGSS